MLSDKEAGIDCSECGHKETVDSQDQMEALKQKLEWNDFGDPFCPVCGDTVWFEDYLD